MKPFFQLPATGQDATSPLAKEILYLTFVLKYEEYEKVLGAFESLKDDLELNEFCLHYLPFRVSGTTRGGETCSQLEIGNPID